MQFMDAGTSIKTNSNDAYDYSNNIKNAALRLGEKCQNIHSKTSDSSSISKAFFSYNSFVKNIKTLEDSIMLTYNYIQRFNDVMSNVENSIKIDED